MKLRLTFYFYPEKGFAAIIPTVSCPCIPVVGVLVSFFSAVSFSLPQKAKSATTSLWISRDALSPNLQSLQASIPVAEKLKLFETASPNRIKYLLHQSRWVKAALPWDVVYNRQGQAKGEAVTCSSKLPSLICGYRNQLKLCVNNPQVVAKSCLIGPYRFSFL